MIIAIDGPAGTGKGTISKLIAERLGFVYVDTGAMYRAITLKMLREDIKVDELEKIEELLNSTKIDFKIGKNINVGVNDESNSNKINNNETSNNISQNYNQQRVFLDGEEVSEEIRKPLVNEHVSPYSAVKIIRAKMVELQRKIAEGKDVIMEGRDITTVVFPNADIKIYLTASPEERAMRRYKELIEKGIETTYEETLESINKRDYNDMHKAIGALKIADGAIVVDTTMLSIEEVYEKLKQIIENAQ